MIDIINIRNYFDDDRVLISEHAALRFRQRNIKIKDIRNAINFGEIIEQYPQDYPYPSCLILGKAINNQYLHIVVSDEGTSSRIITAYYPDKNKWSADFKIRKDSEQ